MHDESKKRESRTIQSPKENIAEKEVLIVETATTKIKEIIVSDVAGGVPKSQTEQKINLIIAQAVNKLNDPVLNAEVKQTLIANAQGWYYKHITNMKVLANNMARELSAVGFGQLAMQVTPSTMVRWDKEQVFRPYRDNAPKGLAIIQDYEKRVKNELIALSADPPISTRLTNDGKPYKINLRNRAEMKIRYEANLQDVERLKNEGVDLVWTSSHADCSLRCQPYQGKLYSISGKTGVTKSGERYTPLSEALEGPKGDGNGIINGYNCRHRLIKYFEGSRPPVEYTKEQIERERKLDTRQRQYENNIRNLKTQERLFRAQGNKKLASQLRKRWQRLNVNYQQFSLRNGRAYYPWRTRISDDETEAENYNER